MKMVGNRKQNCDFEGSRGVGRERWREKGKAREVDKDGRGRKEGQRKGGVA